MILLSNIERATLGRKFNASIERDVREACEKLVI
jgi:hypothetical protein